MARTRWIASGALFASALAVAGTPVGPLHVPSPDWRDQVLYFLMIDRFDDADRTNSDQHAAEYDPADNAKYSGGDLRGVQRRLPYIQGLGFTAVWITPPVANQWWNPQAHYGGYHGYWATDFSAIDAHFGTKADYANLSKALHGAGMYLVQDIVVNHTANYLRYDKTWTASDPARGVDFVRDTQGRTAPVQSPFDRNDPRDPAQAREAIYHWTPDIVDFANETQRLTWQLAGLDDMDTDNPVVRAALRKSYGDWIREAGVDAFRVDTALYVPPAFFQDFLEADDPKAPGVLRVARETGRKDFHVFGEAFAMDKPFDDTQSKRIAAYMRMPDGTPLMPGMLDFPLYATATDVFARGAPTAQLGDRIARRMRDFADPWRMVTFIDNHDVDRFLSAGDEAGLKQALLMLMTLPGIPAVWQGTEQGFTEQRAAMFAGGYGSNGRDHFDAEAPLAQYLKQVIALRRSDKVFSRGTPKVVRDSPVGPGVLAYTMRGADGDARLVVFNTAAHPVLVDNLETGVAGIDEWQAMFALGGALGDQPVIDRRMTLVLPPRSAYVWKEVTRESSAISNAVVPMLAPLDRDRFAGDFDVHGALPDGLAPTAVRIVVDDDLAHAIPVTPRASAWTARIDTSAMLDPAVPHSVVAWVPGGASARRTFRVDRQWVRVASVEDPHDDDAGPDGRYTYPSDASYAPRQGDIEHVDVFTAGASLKIVVRMRAISTPWNPPNGFDHVAFSLFVEVPGAGEGARAMPQQFAELPDGMRWHYRVRANGWSNAAFTSHGATATADGTPAPAPKLDVDAAVRTITFTIPASALGRPRTLQGARVHVTTWDYDGGYRALAPVAGPHAFGGGDPARDARILDTVGPIRLP
ncbi:alpha-amylase [Lysobacter helvus]|uniref:Alpha-amylase n=2 Tax=Lysobacteraceae TaxID=32033 RepID=A0ABN6FUC2_9GAMM|nr:MULTISPECIES: alpha-amylase family glycosyl hydrolase [Lysobacter]BCT93263.1 alpha-amylase [Lysobacter caseinilyticus]BCT96415.1 alpha-amylase [Lysobacter helvus]